MSYLCAAASSNREVMLSLDARAVGGAGAGLLAGAALALVKCPELAQVASALQLRGCSRRKHVSHCAPLLKAATLISLFCAPSINQCELLRSLSPSGAKLKGVVLTTSSVTHDTFTLWAHHNQCQGLQPQGGAKAKRAWCSWGGSSSATANKTFDNHAH